MQEISAEQVRRRISAENPWWTEEGRATLPFANLKPRLYLDLLQPLISAESPRRAVVVLGPRRVGKTVILHHAIQNLIAAGTNPQGICYVSVDHPIYNGLSLEQLLDHASAACGLNLRSTPAFMFLDEIQYMKDWQRHLKALVDSYPSLKCVASGSAAAALERGSKESGAGRFTDFPLPPLTFHEYLELLGKSSMVSITGGEGKAPSFASADLPALNREFLDYINYGGYPEVIFSDQIRADPGRFIKSDIIDKVLLRDLPGLYGIRDIQELNHLFTTLAFNTANEISLEELSKNSGVAKNTIKRYIEYLEAAFLIKVVHRIDRQAKRFRRANFFKVYLTNPSLRAALFSPIAENDPAVGFLVETAIFSQWFHAAETDVLTYARWNTGEVDIVYLGGDQKPIWTVEVKWSDRPAKDHKELENTLSFCKENRLRAAVVTTLTACDSRAHEGIALELTPASLYCFTVGYNLVRGKKTRLHISGQSPDQAVAAPEEVRIEKS
jgi:predicted AAA+ superfamily ATPase